jgi:Copper type II ascorbate-dependent monooxygenase, C-terminal domain
MLRGILCAAFVALPALASAQSRSVTYHEDVVPVLQKHCQACHRPGEAAPFSMLTYRDTRPWAAAMKRAAVSRQMPPWHADPAVGHFKNDRRLAQAEIDTIARWADSGAPEGDPSKAPAPLAFLDGWNIGQPDKILEMPHAFSVPASGTIDYQWIVMPTGIEKDTWIEGVEVRPGDRSVVHHVIAFYRQPGSKWLVDAKPGIPTPKGSGDSEAGMADGAIGGYVPGLPAGRLAPGRAIFLPAGADIVLQVHYNATGKATTDRTKVGLVFARQDAVERSFQIGIVNPTFVIPPGDPNYRVDADMTVDSDVRVIGFTPHMHLRGKSFEFRATLPDGTREVLLRVPKYDFNWQLTYDLAEERVFPKGTKFEATATFDNSENNRFNPDPKASVRFGDQTWDEMMVGFIDIAIKPDMDLAKLVRMPPRPTGAQE